MAAESLGLSSGFCFCVGSGNTGPKLLGTQPIEFAVGIGYPRTDYDRLFQKPSSPAEDPMGPTNDPTLLVQTRNRLAPWESVENADFAESESRPNFTDWVNLTGFKNYTPDIHQVI